MNLDDVCQAVKGAVILGTTEQGVKEISTDSRNLKFGSLFFALKGEQFDGHRFVTEAYKRGAVGAVVSGVPENLTVGANEKFCLILVPDTLEALQQLAGYWREKFQIPVVGVSGSNGKTTTKDMIASVLEEKFPVLRTEGNFNNEIGLPLTLLRLNTGHRAAVLEMAMRGQGQIKLLCDIALPDIGVITNIGTAHFELLGSEENIARAKGELLDALPEHGLAVLNSEDGWSVRLGEELKVKMNPIDIVYYGFTPEADFRAEQLEPVQHGTRFMLCHQGQRHEAFLPFLGKHNILNALAAAAIGHRLGLSFFQIIRGLAKVQISGKRLEKQPGIIGSQIINDTYNANPTSTRASLDVLTATEGKRKIAVLGNMRELGELAEAGHREVGRYIVDQGIDYLITVGDLAGFIADEARKSGMDPLKIYSFNNNLEASLKLAEIIKERDVVLVKGSRAMSMEEITEYLSQQEGGPGR